MRSSPTIRLVVLLEATKGLVVLLAGIGVMSFTHVDIQHFVEELVLHMHLNPAHHYPNIFVEYARQLTDARLALMAAIALTYSLVRFIEAYGLWYCKRWAEWFAAISGSIYIPLEIYELFHGGGRLTVLALVINILVVGLMVKELRRSNAKKTGSAS